MNNPTMVQTDAGRKGMTLAVGSVRVSTSHAMIVLLLLLATALSGCSNPTEATEDQTQRQEQTIAGKALTVGGDGLRDVELVNWEGPDIRIETTKHIPGRVGTTSQQQLDNLKVDIQKDGDTVRVNVSPPPGGIVIGETAYVTLRISLPPQVTSDVQVESGNITVREVQGTGVLASNSGTIDAQNTQGDLTFKTDSGNISASGHKGTLHTASESGTITAHGASDVVLDIQSGSGRVEFEGSLNPSSDHAIVSDSGEISLQLPADSKLRLNASTSSGELKTDFNLGSAIQDEKRLIGVINDGSATLSVTSQSGNIEILSK